MKKTILFLLSTFLCIYMAMAQDQGPVLWNKLDVQQADRSALYVQPQQYELYELALESLKEQLAACKIRPAIPSPNDYITIHFPLFGERLQPFRLMETPVMEAKLQAKYDNIRTYTGQGVDHPEYTIKLDVGPAGFHAMILTDKGTIFIAPAYANRLDQYLVFQKQDLSVDEEEAFKCLVSNEDILPDLHGRMPTNPTGTERQKLSLGNGRYRGVYPLSWGN
jgi:hypothetical protein